MDYIYALINEKNNKRYIGRTTDYEKRISTHMSLLKTGNHPNRELQSDYNEYGDVFWYKILAQGNFDGISIEKAYMVKFKTYLSAYGYNTKDPAVYSKETKSLAKDINPESTDYFENVNIGSEDVPNTFGERVKARRINLEMTQEQLAKRLGYVSRNAVCQVEKGNSHISLKTIERYSSALNCSPQYLAFGITE